jgi:hypothetical protein
MIKHSDRHLPNYVRLQRNNRECRSMRVGYRLADAHSPPVSVRVNPRQLINDHRER